MYKISARMLNLLQRVGNGNGMTLDNNTFHRFKKSNLIEGGNGSAIVLTHSGKALLEAGERQEMERRDRQLRHKYSHYKHQSVRRVAGETRLYAEVVCEDCGTERTVFTSDLFQVTRCAKCQVAQLQPV